MRNLRRQEELTRLKNREQRCKSMRLIGLMMALLVLLVPVKIPAEKLGTAAMKGAGKSAWYRTFFWEILTRTGRMDSPSG